MIINLKNGKKYIGSTTNFSRRSKNHFYELKNKVHHSISLQNSWNKNTPQDYKFIILEKIENNYILKQREQYYLDYFKSYEKEFGYNICKIAGDPGSCRNLKTVYQFSLNGQFIKTHKSAGHASRDIGVFSGGEGVTKCCKNKYRFYKGFIFSYNTSLSIERIDFANNPCKRTEESKNKMSIAAKNRKDKRAIIQMDLSGNFIREWECTRNACDELGLSNGQISDCLNGKWKQARGFKWKFKDKWIENNEIIDEQNK